MWRIHETHKGETKAVKKALKDAGINAKVGHGKGTAWAWLHVEIGTGSGEHIGVDEYGRCRNRSACLRCRTLNELSREALRISQKVTGRTGEYSGDINIYSQDDKVNNSAWKPQEAATA